MNKCEYCEKSFSTKSNLINHKKTAKYCLNKQQKNIIKEYKCCCQKIFNTKIIFERHNNICKIYKEENTKFQNNIYLQKLENENKIYLEQLEKKDKHIKELEDKLANIALAGVTKSTTINNNNINNNNKILNISSLNINKESVHNVLENSFTHDTIIDGQKSLAKFVVDNLLKDNSGNLTYICTDPSRQIFKFKDTLGEVQKDVKANKLTNILLEGGIRDINSKVAQEWWTKDDGEVDGHKFIIMEPKASEIHNISSDNSIFVNELTNITTK